MESNFTSQFERNNYSAGGQNESKEAEYNLTNTMTTGATSKKSDGGVNINVGAFGGVGSPQNVGIIDLNTNDELPNSS